ncbi:MAG: crossover junction endodeoxyribonuclease RuvC [Bdellovibrionales bacterium]|nr:crossover junction endodeoxyribonuclease RuvC [Bdellovibrionales bacterium]
MIIAGIDPGSQRTGYAVVESRGAGLIIHDVGVWNLVQATGTPRPSLGARLEILADQAREFFAKWNPQVIGFEKAVAFKNISSAFVLSEARGVVRLAAYETLGSADLRLVELSPTSVKKEAASFGLSSKGGVRKGLALRFPNLETLLGDQDLSSDAFDALAIAWTAWVLKGRYRTREPHEQHGI